VLNGHSANIFIGAQRFIRVEYSSGYGDKIQRIKAVDVGTKITVTPWTGGNGEITTKISPEVSNIVELDRATGLPTLSSRRASTTVRVKDGETIVIGGLTTRQEYDTKRKVPILGDLPLIGHLFRSRSKATTETELLILITPTLLSESGHLPSMEESKIKERMLGD
jgi:type II secretory pathway component GspD/PulD (secretin)